MQEKATQEMRERREIYFNNIKKLHKFISFMYRQNCLKYNANCIYQMNILLMY